MPRSKSLAEFQGPDARRFDFVFTVCDEAANEECPAWAGQPVSAHRGLSDPFQAVGARAEKGIGFHQAYGAVRDRILASTAQPIAAMERIALRRAVDDIGRKEIGEFA